MRRELQERTFEFACRIVMLCTKLDGQPGVSRTLWSQLLRSGTSVGANIEEGQGSQSEADFLAKYSIACKESRETKYWLRLLIATSMVPKEQLEPLLEECSELVAILTAIVKKLKAKRK